MDAKRHVAMVVYVKVLLNPRDRLAIKHVTLGGDDRVSGEQHAAQAAIFIFDGAEKRELIAIVQDND